MLRTTTIAAALAGLLASAAPALAQSGDWHPADPWGDATVTRDEARARAEERFAAIDTNHDGVLSPEELDAAAPYRRNGGGGGHRHRPDGGGEGFAHGPGGGSPMAERGLQALADDNGRIARDVFIEAQLRRFDRADADHDGKLTKAEREAAFAEMRARMEARWGGQQPGDQPPSGGGDGDGNGNGDRD